MTQQHKTQHTKHLASSTPEPSAARGVEPTHMMVFSPLFTLMPRAEFEKTLPFLGQPLYISREDFEAAHKTNVISNGDLANLSTSKGETIDIENYQFESTDSLKNSPLLLTTPSSEVMDISADIHDEEGLKPAVKPARDTVLKKQKKSVRDGKLSIKIQKPKRAFKPKFKLFMFLGYSLKQSTYLSNIVAWAWSKGEGEAFYKTNKEMEEETGLSKWDVKTIKSKLKKDGLFTQGKRSPYRYGGATPYFVNFEKVMEVSCEDSIKLITQKISHYTLEKAPCENRPTIHI